MPERRWLDRPLAFSPHFDGCGIGVYERSRANSLWID